MAEEQTATPAFETSLTELERIVRELEGGELPLERSLALFEKGIALSEGCKKQLEDAETRVEILLKKGSNVVAAPFEPEKQR